jgi:4-oxalocrotonate tautomerase
MPLVRIDLPAATSTAEVVAVSNAVHRALVELFRVPEDDRFQLIGRRSPDELVCAPRYLGIEHSDQVVMVQITCAPGRSVAMKQQLYAAIATGIAGATRFAADDVIINLVESLRENWSFGRGIAQYAVEDRDRAAAQAS